MIHHLKHFVHAVKFHQQTAECGIGTGKRLDCISGLTDQMVLHNLRLCGVRYLYGFQGTGFQTMDSIIRPETLLLRIRRHCNRFTHCSFHRAFHQVDTGCITDHVGDIISAVARCYLHQIDMIIPINPHIKIIGTGFHIQGSQQALNLLMDRILNLCRHIVREARGNRHKGIDALRIEMVIRKAAEHQLSIHGKSVSGNLIAILFDEFFHNHTFSSGKRHRILQFFCGFFDAVNPSDALAARRIHRLYDDRKTKFILPEVFECGGSLRIPLCLGGTKAVFR